VVTGPPVRFGVLGCSDIGWRRTLPALAAEPSVELAAVASRDPAKAARFAARFGADPVTGYDALLERGDLDAVYIPLPTGLHAAWVTRALDAGLHVLAEKPLATSLAEAEPLIAAARARGLVLRENLTFVFHGQQRAVRDLVLDGAIGPVRSLTAVFGIPPLPAGDIRYRADLGGGALRDLGIYVAQTALMFLGPQYCVRGAALSTDPDTGVDLAGAALVSFDSGATASLQFGFQHAYRSGYALWGERGSITLERAYTAPASHQPRLRIERADGVEYRHLPPDDQFANTVRAFARCVREDGPEPTDGPRILRRAALLDDIRAAAARPGTAEAVRELEPAGAAGTR
jgi:dTDP-3,4-didehydro-2,6-dideoxy-alpha-D-glucose 3-reductase